jgi:hypothetical protein
MNNGRLRGRLAHGTDDPKPVVIVSSGLADKCARYIPLETGTDVNAEGRLF